MLTALNLQFSLVPIYGSLADKTCLTLCNDLINSWQWALLEVLLIIILQREEDRLYWLTSTFATLLNSLEAKATQILTSAESFDRAAANHYWCLVVLNAYYWWFNLGEKTQRGYSSETALMMIEHWPELIPTMRYVRNKGQADMLCIVKHSITFVVYCTSQHAPLQAFNITSPSFPFYTTASHTHDCIKIQRAVLVSHHR